VRRSMKVLTHLERERIVEAVRAQFPVSSDEQSRYALMTREDLRSLPAGVEVGGHTHRHVILSRETPEVQKEEIVGNFHALAAAVGKPPSTFAYPNGQLDDVTDDTLRFVDEAGYRAAVTASTGVPNRHADVLTLPRVSAAFVVGYGTDALDLLPLRIAAAQWRRA
jgi:peptidoglycan/xylan/chitin deacetylase (PgdA/CDA1 family)